jgi:glutamate carboxypeptidase
MTSDDLSVRVLHELGSREAEMLALLEQMVRIDSGSYHKPGIDAMAECLAAELKSLGFTTRMLAESDWGNHLLAHRTSSGHPRLFLSCHLDTVTRPEHFAAGPFVIRNRRVYGPGVADMKGGITQMVMALRVLRDLGHEPLPELTVFGTGDEEVGSVLGRPHIEREGRQCQYVLVVEPARPDGSYVASRWALAAFYLDIQGKPAHLGDPAQHGINANLELAHKILALEALHDPAAGRIVAANLVQGGIARQTVSPYATAHVDVRAKTTQGIEELARQVEMILRLPHLAGIEPSVRGTISRPALEPNPGSARLFQMMAALAKRVGVKATQAETRGGGDGSFLASLGLPTLDGMGPIGRNNCTPQEYIEIDSMMPRTAILALTIAQLAEENEGGAWNWNQRYCKLH